MKYDLNSEKISLTISLLNSDLEIAGSDRTDLEIDFSDLRKNAADEIFDISFENSNLKITQKSKKLSQFMSGEDYPVKIFVPKSVQMHAEIDGLSGDINISGLGSMKGSIKTKSGDINIKEIGNFEAEVSSISGDIILAALKGSLLASSISGDIVESGSEYSKIIIKSVSGDLTMNCSFDLAEDALIGTVSGDISINFTKYNGEKEISLKSISGDIELTGNKPAEEKIHISQVKGDFAKFNPINKDFFKGSFGSVFRNLKDHIKNVSDNNATSEIREPKKENGNVQAILSMVAEGKISVDEAEKLIKAIR